MMRFDLSELIRTVGMSQRYTFDELPAGDSDSDIVYLQPVRGEVVVTNSGGALIVRGILNTTISGECARCLTDLTQPIDARIEEQFMLREVENSTYHDRSPEVVQDEEHEVPVGLFEGKIMNFDILVRQAVILAAPIKSLCRDDCKGLCLKCGADLNRLTCGCASVSTTTPLSSLAQKLADKAERN